MNAELIKQVKPGDLICIEQFGRIKYVLFHKYTGRSIQYYHLYDFSFYKNVSFYKYYINVTDDYLRGRVTVPDLRFVDKTILDWYIETKQFYDTNIK